MKLTILGIALLLILAAGCASITDLEKCELESIIPHQPDHQAVLLPDGYGDDYGYTVEREYNSGGSIASLYPHTMLMAHGGARRVERRHWTKNKWPEFGIDCIHVISEDGLAIDWALLGMKFINKTIDYNNSTSSFNETIEDISGVEAQLGFRYLYPASENVWPFIRGYALFQYAVSDSEIVDLNSTVKADIEGDGDGFGGGVAAGVDFAFGALRLEIGSSFSWVRTTLDWDATIGPVTVNSGSDKSSVGAEPSIWISIGSEF